MLRLRAGAELVDDLEGGGIDHVDRVGSDFWHIHSLQGLTNGLTKMTRGSLAIEVGWINYGGHALHAIDPVIFSLSGSSCHDCAKGH